MPTREANVAASAPGSSSPSKTSRPQRAGQSRKPRAPLSRAQYAGGRTRFRPRTNPRATPARCRKRASCVLVDRAAPARRHQV